MKLCKDCKYYYRRDEECIHESSMLHHNPVDGKKYYHNARTVRLAPVSSKDHCGLAAKHFEEKPPKIWKDYLPAWVRNLL